MLRHAGLGCADLTVLGCVATDGRSLNRAEGVTRGVAPCKGGGEIAAAVRAVGKANGEKVGIVDGEIARFHRDGELAGDVVAVFIQDTRLTGNHGWPDARIGGGDAGFHIHHSVGVAVKLEDRLHKALDGVLFAVVEDGVVLVRAESDLIEGIAVQNADAAEDCGDRIVCRVGVRIQRPEEAVLRASREDAGGKAPGLVAVAGGEAVARDGDGGRAEGAAVVFAACSVGSEDHLALTDREGAGLGDDGELARDVVAVGVKNHGRAADGGRVAAGVRSAAGGREAGDGVGDVIEGEAGVLQAGNGLEGAVIEGLGGIGAEGDGIAGVAVGDAQGAEDAVDAVVCTLGARIQGVGEFVTALAHEGSGAGDRVGGALPRGKAVAGDGNGFVAELAPGVGVLGAAGSQGNGARVHSKGAVLGEDQELAGNIIAVGVRDVRGADNVHGVGAGVHGSALGAQAAEREELAVHRKADGRAAFRSGAVQGEAVKGVLGAVIEEFPARGPDRELEARIVRTADHREGAEALGDAVVRGEGPFVEGPGEAVLLGADHGAAGGKGDGDAVAGGEAGLAGREAVGRKRHGIIGLGSAVGIDCERTRSHREGTRHGEHGELSGNVVPGGVRDDRRADDGHFRRTGVGKGSRGREFGDGVNLVPDAEACALKAGDGMLRAVIGEGSAAGHNGELVGGVAVRDGEGAGDGSDAVVCI